MTELPEWTVALMPGDGMRLLATQVEHGGNPDDEVTITRGALVHLYRELERLYPIAFRASQVPGWRDFHAARAARYILGEEKS